MQTNQLVSLVVSREKPDQRHNFLKYTKLA